ncbi:hypothetical protein JVT61DRAFT_9604 [Boletus reticuloceps]|uniref:Uncharacterized protein n=1 Tax=Boletus reticuloceps TaxID=495285 RepID=A0A8I3A5S0_9AGAM|nr:hypothetical protein JVT61DRAFT_9604 [Boletus reticuloceps]
MLQKKCGIDPPLAILLHSNIRWGTVEGMLSRSYVLRQAINLVINSADELYGQITTIRRDSCAREHIPWSVFVLKPSDWECVQDMRAVILDANNIQQLFSDEHCATLWQAIPALEELQMAWENKRDSSKYNQYRNAIQDGLDKINKYYNCLDDKPVYTLTLVLHPYYKLDYIKMAWGRADQQAEDIAAGNRHAKNWHDEAMQVVEDAM